MDILFPCKPGLLQPDRVQIPRFFFISPSALFAPNLWNMAAYLFLLYLSHLSHLFLELCNGTGLLQLVHHAPLSLGTLCYAMRLSIILHHVHRHFRILLFSSFSSRPVSIYLQNAFIFVVCTHVGVLRHLREIGRDCSSLQVNSPSAQGDAVLNPMWHAPKDLPAPSTISISLPPTNSSNIRTTDTPSRTSPNF